MARASLAVGMVLLLRPAAAYADGGMVQWSGDAGPYRLTVFTTPTPLRAGPIDVSVLLQDRHTGRPILDGTVTIRLTAERQLSMTQEKLATTEAASNKLLRAATLDAGTAGAWQIDVAVEGPRGPARISCNVEVAEAPPRWADLSLWLTWPVLPIGLYAWQQWLVRGRDRSPGTTPRPRSPFRTNDGGPLV
ncbi:MAG: hypothetical protein NZ700_17495 [Gemmataceae bacterium]|nr:hypothetical protein [Gemmataceae bacterium]MDW8265755.1 hypothetical protein [Gemmataceae bacterium]